MIARRRGHNWFIGGMNRGESRTLPVTLNFLENGKTYIAHQYTDDPDVDTPTHVRIDRDRVTADTVLKIPMGAQGGFAVRIVPE